MIAAPLTLHQTHALEHPQVLGDRWLAHLQQCGQSIHAESVRVSLATKELEQPEARRIGKSTEKCGLLRRVFLNGLSHFHKYMLINLS